MRNIITWEVILDLTSAIEKVYPEFKRERKDSKEALVKALSICYTVRHNEKQYFVLPKVELERMGTRLATVNKMLHKYPLLIWTGNKPSSFKKEAKRYVATKEFEDVLNEFNRLANPPVMVYYRHEDSKKGAYVILSKAPSKKTYVEKPDYVCHANVDIGGLEGYTLQQGFEENFDINQRIVIERLIAIAKEGKGMLTQEYFRGESGRLFSRGIESVQNMPKEVRKAAFSGCYDIDFVNAHYRIAAHFSNDPAINEYAYSPEVIRYMVSRDLEIDEKYVKAGYLMLLYGAGTSLRKDSSLVEMLGKDKAKEFLEHPRTKVITKGIANLKKDLSEGDYLEEREDKTVDQLVAMFLQKCEGEILDVCIKYVTPEALFFDGFITKNDIDIQYLEHKIYEELGINIALTKEVV